MKQLIQQAAGGDRKALRALLFEHRQLMEGVMNRFLWDRSGREDVVQNICVKVMQAIGAFSGKCNFSTWVFRIAVNECIDANRRFKHLKVFRAASERDMDLFPDINAEDGLDRLLPKETDSLAGILLKTFILGGSSRKEISEIKCLLEEYDRIPARYSDQVFLKGTALFLEKQGERIKEFVEEEQKKKGEQNDPEEAS